MKPEILYIAEATATGGREGRAFTSDDRLDVDLDVPTELGGSGVPAPTPSNSSPRAMQPASSRR
jgi:osmotically inducible protein OsmC